MPALGNRASGPLATLFMFSYFFFDLFCVDWEFFFLGGPAAACIYVYVYNLSFAACEPPLVSGWNLPSLPQTPHTVPRVSVPQTPHTVQRVSVPQTPHTVQRVSVVLFINDVRRCAYVLSRRPMPATRPPRAAR